jgi:hypothetical protein
MTITLDGTTGITTPTTSTTGEFVTSVTSFKNRIINGAMVIDQRNAGASITPTAGQYSVDRWKFTLSQASKFTAQQNAASVTLPAGFANYLGVTSSSAYSVAAGDYFAVQQVIEGFNYYDLAWGTASAVTVTLSFRVYSSLTGTFGGAITNGTSNYSYPFTYSIPVANTWTTISVTIAGPTGGTWVGATNGYGLILNLGLGVGTTYSGTAGAWAATNYVSATGATSVVGTNGATFYITGVQLEKGSTATSFDYRDYGTELALCQRYYQQIFGTSNLALFGRNNAAAAGQGPGVNIFYKVSMRAAPTGTVAGTWTKTNTSGGGNPAFNNIGTEVASLYVDSAAAGDCYYYAPSSSVGVTMSAEL